MERVFSHRFLRLIGALSMCVAVWFCVLQCVAVFHVCGSILQVCCRVLQCVAVCFRVSQLLPVGLRAVPPSPECCKVLQQCAAVSDQRYQRCGLQSCSALRTFAELCSMLQCLPSANTSVLQCVAAFSSATVDAD
mmetsp:Transcript_845/g.1052  ORF Transcript_845/g.1052 Transcript_845/m.1052 type:complete len:135 (-) Transcript_845:1472-1876(-)